MQKILLLSALAVLMLPTACQSDKNKKELDTKLVVTTPLLKDTTVTREYVCQIHAIQHIEMRALEKGYLQNIYVDEGQFVKKGQIMFRIMPMLYEAETQKAKAEADYAEIEYRNTLALAEKNVVSKNELAMAKARYDKARAELSLARIHLGFTEVKAPFSGIMDHFQVRLGSLVDEGDLLTTLSDNSKMWVYFNVPESEYLDYKTHATRENLSKVNLKMANNQVFQFPGVVETIEADFNNETGNIAFRATFPNPDGLLRHGETGNILMTIPMKHALIIPQKATFEVLEKKYVFVVDKKNVVHQREVTILAEMPDVFVIKGIHPDDKILLEGIRKVSDGQKIRYSFEHPKKVLSGLKVYVE